MTLNELLEELKNVKKGSYRRIELVRQAHTLKSSPVEITKRSIIVGRLGLNYKHIQDQELQQRLANPQEGAQQRSSWASKVENNDFLIVNNKTGAYYLEVYTARNTKHKAKVSYMVDNKEVSKESIQDYLLSSEKRSNSTLVFSIPIENILSI